jgi:hypothetical protein
LSGLLLKHMLAALLQDYGMLTEHELLFGHPAQSAGLQLLYSLTGAVTDLIAGKNVSGYWQHKQFALQASARAAHIRGRGDPNQLAGCQQQQACCVTSVLAVFLFTLYWAMSHP